MGIPDYEDVFICVVAIILVVISFVISSLWIYVLALTVLLVCIRAARRMTAEKIKVKGEGVFITGCDTGFGHDLSVRLDQLGFTVFAGCLLPDGDGANKLRTSCSPGLHVVPLDVTSDDSVRAARDYVVKHLPENGLWAVVNNAMRMLKGDIEWQTINQHHQVMDVNYYGALRTTRALLYLVRKTQGRVVIVTSVRAVFPWPDWCAYHASKSALETMADSLRLEMTKFGVKVAKIRPGQYGFATSAASPANFQLQRQADEVMWKEAPDDVKGTYGKNYIDARTDWAINLTLESSGSASSTKPVIDALCDAIMSERPRTTYTVDGAAGWFDSDTTFSRYYGYLPTFITDWILCKWTKCDR